VKYPKIHSLWKRQGWYLEKGKKNNPAYQSGRQSFIVGDYAIPEFGNIKTWLVQEKIDGINIRIEYCRERVIRGNDLCTILSLEFSGRTEEAILPHPLDDILFDHFTHVLLEQVFPLELDKIKKEVILFGEGYGSRIQKGGGNYRKDQSFILFDVYVDGWWLKQDDVKKIADKLGISYAPIIGIMTEDEIAAYVKSKPLSLCSVIPQVMEGIIARPEQLLLLRNGEPLMMKLKCKEF
jgi:hypothetical protein